MAKQILISQYDYGVIFNVTLLNSDKTPLVLTNEEVKFYIVKPDGTKKVITDVDIIDENGVVEFELGREHTDVVGNYSIYVELSNAAYEITTVFAQNYYVMAEHGGE